MDETLFILGTMDPEMEEIKNLIIKLGYKYSYSNEHIVLKKRNVFIETKPFGKNYVCLDHHHNSDFGYHLDYKNFVQASSIGQFFEYILKSDFEHVSNVLKLKVYDNPEHEMGFFFDKKWYIGIYDKKVKIPKKIVYIAGIDHCLRDVYLGKCSGIKIDNMFNKRLEHIAFNLNKDKNLVKKRAEDFYNRYFICQRTRDIMDLRMIEFEKEFYPLDYLIIREIALYLNQPIVLKLNLCDYNKLMFLSLSKKQVKKILRKKSFKNIEFKEVFGVPNRNYAGGIY